MAEDKEPPLDRSAADRPLECSECKKPISVRYTEIIGNTITHTSMCADCPQLEHRLRGITGPATLGSVTEVSETGLVCGDCGTSLSNVRSGTPLGCAHCYEVFADQILVELRSANRIPQPSTTQKKSAPLHVGRSPGEVTEISATSRLAALNEALSDTLHREDYEQAAWLRDQIKQLTEGRDEGKQ